MCIRDSFYSLWGSGSIGESITCKYQKNKKFVMAKHCNPFGKIGEVQKGWSMEFKRISSLISNYRNNEDLQRVVHDIVPK